MDNSSEGVNIHKDLKQEVEIKNRDCYVSEGVEEGCAEVKKRKIVCRNAT